MKINGISTSINNPKSSSNKLAVLLPGYLDSKDYGHLKILAEDLANAGYAVIRLNPTGTWDSDGKIEEYSTTQYLKDVRTVIDHMIGKDGYKEILIAGHSLGGFISLLYAAEDKRISQAIAIMSPYSVDSVWNEKYKQWKELGYRSSKRDIPGTDEFKQFSVPYTFVGDRKKYDVLDVISKINVPVLFVAGEEDMAVPLEAIKLMYGKANEPKKFIIIPGVGHDYRHDEVKIRKVNKEIIRFLCEAKKIIVVDENDAVIGSKERFKITYNDIYRVTGLWIINSKGEILLAQRAFTKSHSPGGWGTAVAGTVEAGESYEESIYKEAEEELGIRGEKFEKGPHTRSEGPWQHFTQWYFFKTDKQAKEFQIDKNEVEQVKWFKPEEILKESEKYPEKFLKSLPKRVKEFSDISKEHNV